jgi:hypothetical protein
MFVSPCKQFYFSLNTCNLSKFYVKVLYQKSGENMKKAFVVVCLMIFIWNSSTSWSMSDLHPENQKLDIKANAVQIFNQTVSQTLSGTALRLIEIFIIRPIENWRLSKPVPDEPNRRIRLVTNEDKFNISLHNDVIKKHNLTKEDLEVIKLGNSIIEECGLTNKPIDKRLTLGERVRQMNNQVEGNSVKNTRQE